MSAILAKYVSSVINAYTTTIQSCPVFAYTSGTFDIVDTGGDVVIEKVNWSQIANVKSECLSQALTSRTTVQSIETVERNFVDELKAYFTNSDPITIGKLVQELTATISNVFIQDCSVNVLSEMEIRIKNVQGNVIINNVNWVQAMDVLSKCVQGTVAKSQEYVSLLNLLEKKSDVSKPTLVSQLIPYVWVLPCVLTSILLGLFGWGFDFSTLFFLLGVLFVSFGFAKFTNSYPYPKLSSVKQNSVMSVSIGIGLCFITIGAIRYTRYS